MWDDALCKECDEQDRAEAQHVLGMMSQLVDGVKDQSGNVIGGVVGGVVDHSKGFVEHVSGETSKAVDHLGGETSKLVEHVRERSEGMRQDKSFKELEQRELQEGNRSSLLDAFGRDLFRHSTEAVETTTKHVLERTKSPRTSEGDEPSLSFGPEIEARCSWCDASSTHTLVGGDRAAQHVVALPVARKPEYECASCARRTCPCDIRPVRVRQRPRALPCADGGDGRCRPGR